MPITAEVALAFQPALTTLAEKLKNATQGRTFSVEALMALAKSGSLIDQDSVLEHYALQSLIQNYGYAEVVEMVKMVVPLDYLEK